MGVGSVKFVVCYFVLKYDYSFYCFWVGVMATITFDTLTYAKNLEANGFTTEQAETLASENKRVFNEFAETQLATKSDLLTVKDELKADIQEIKVDLLATENRLDKRLVLLQWSIALVLLVVGIPALQALFNL